MNRSTIDFSKISRVLVVHLRQFGDVLLTSPMFTVLKNHAPQVEVDALVYDHTAEMLTLHPAITSVHRVMRRRKDLSPGTKLAAELRLLRKLHVRHYDMLINVHPHPSAIWLSWILRPRYSVAPQKGGRYNHLWSGNFTHVLKSTSSKGRHQVELNLDLLRIIGLFPGEDERRLVLVPGEEAEMTMRHQMATAGLPPGGFVVIHAPSNLRYKCLPPESTARLIEELVKQGERVVLTGSASEFDIDLIRKIRAACSAELVDFSGRLSMKQVAALIREAKLVVAVDSAPMHIAAAMQTPVVGIFGPSYEHMWGPWRVPHRIVSSDRHSCRSCNQWGCAGSGVSDCLATLPVESILTAANQVLAERANQTTRK